MHNTTFTFEDSLYFNYYCFHNGFDLSSMYALHWKKHPEDYIGFEDHIRNKISKSLDDCFPTLEEDGGTLGDLNDLKKLLKIHARKAFKVATMILNEDLSMTFSDKDIEIIRKHILYCIKVADNPTIYKAIAKQNNWKYDD